MGDLGDPWFPKESILQVVDFPCLSCVVCLGGLGTLMTVIFSMRIMKLIIQGGSVFLQTLWNSCSTSSHVYLYWLNRLNLMFSWFNHLKLPVLLSRSCWNPEFFIYCLVVCNMNFIFPFSWECHHPNWRSHIVQRGRAQPPTNGI